MPPPTLRPRTVLFDFDGTLVDTATDLAAAINHIRHNRGLESLPPLALREQASAGARGLISTAFGIQPHQKEYAALQEALLKYYANNLFTNTILFSGIAKLLEGLSVANIPWGIVTNRLERFTHPLVEHLALQATVCVVGGDTTPHAKPHPAPLLEAAKRAGQSPIDCWYIGDDLRDIQAGKKAGMKTLVAAWGYALPAQYNTWGADAIIQNPADLLEMILDLLPSHD